MRYVVLVVNNDDSPPATLHDSLASAKDWVRAWLTDPADAHEWQTEPKRLAQALSDLDAIVHEHGGSVRGSDTWKEWIHIAPVEEPVIVSTCRRIGTVTAAVNAEGDPWKPSKDEITFMDMSVPVPLPQTNEERAAALGAVVGSDGNWLPKEHSTGPVRVMRKATLMEDEGHEHEAARFQTHADAQTWIAAQTGYFEPWCYYIAESDIAV